MLVIFLFLIINNFIGFDRINKLKIKMSITRTHMNLSKNQFYGGDGTGRDTYIYNNNGGFCPDKPSLKVEQLGKFLKR